MKKVVYSYVVMRSMFGDIWIGKSIRKADEKKFFSEFSAAFKRADKIFSAMHEDFQEEPIDGEDFDDELASQYEQLKSTTPETAELVRPEMEKYIR